MTTQQSQAKAGITAPKAEGSDLYETPADAVIALLSREPFPSPVWEPAAGWGAISNALIQKGLNVIETDIVSHEGRKRPLFATADFLIAKHPPLFIDRGGNTIRPQAMITNPPFSKLTKFMVHAMAMPMRKWAFLIPLTALSGQDRWQSVYGIRAPGNVYVFSNRIPFRRRGYKGKIAPMGMHAWAVWDRAFDDGTRTRLHWIEETISPTVWSNQ